MAKNVKIRHSTTYSVRGTTFLKLPQMGEADEAGDGQGGVAGLPLGAVEQEVLARLCAVDKGVQGIDVVL